MEEIPLLPLLTQLDCSKCPVKEIPLLPLLTHLDCSACPVKEIPLLPLLTQLDCSKCPVKEIPLLPRLWKLNCSECPMGKIPFLPRLRKLYCKYCTKLVIQPNKPDLSYEYQNSYWLQQNNIQRVILIQRYLRKYLRFCAYIHKEKYSIWLYAPDGPFGWKSRKRLETMVWEKE